MAMIFTAPALAGTSTIRGTVTDADGNPVQGAQVTLFDANRAELKTVDTDAGGNFAFVNANVDTDTCAVRVFYNSGSKTYTNAATYYFVQYPAKGEVPIPIKDTRLDGLHLGASSRNPSRPSADPAWLSAIATSLAFTAVAGASLSVQKRK